MKKIYKSFCILVGFAFLFAACEGMMDVHKEYIKDGEVIYAPKIAASQFYSGKERAYFMGLLWNAPNVKTVDIFWNNGKDSLITPVSPAEGVYTFEISVPLNEEKAYTFDVRTTDIFGHHSLKTMGTASSYGAMYQSSLTNRYIKQMTLVGDDGEISWLAAAEGLVRSEVRYTDVNNEQKVVHVFPDENIAVCPNPKENAIFEYRSLFLPEISAVDTFEVAWETIPYYYRYDRSTWSVISCSDEQVDDGGGMAVLIDDNLNNYWHSQWRAPAAPLPHWAIIDMETAKSIGRIETYRRKGNTNTKSVWYYVSDDPDPDATSWKQIATGTFVSGDLLTLDTSDNTNRGRYLKIYLPDSNSTGQYTSIAEIYVYEKRQ